MKKKLLISNLVYGPLFLRIFTQYHIRSLLSDFSELKDRLEYLVFTDEETRPALENDTYFQKMQELIPVTIGVLEWGDKPLTPTERKQLRYAALTSVFNQSVIKAIEKDSYLTPIVADSVFAKGCISQFFQVLDNTDHDAIFCLPIRTAFEAIAPHLEKFDVNLTPIELFSLSYNFMHPLWVAGHWDSPQFSRLPYTILWNTGDGVIARAFSVAPICFVPNENMLDIKSVSDIEIPALCKNPYWASDWLQAPLIGIDPLVAFYPPFSQKPANPKVVGDWAKKVMHKSQIERLQKEFYYPCKAMLPMTSLIKNTRQIAADAITKAYHSA